HVTEHGDRRCGQDDRQQREHGKTTQSPSAFLVEETSDEGLRLLVGALADVMEADHATAVHEDPRRPCPDRVPVPDREIAVLHDGIEDAELLRRRRDARRRLLPEKLRRVDAHDRQPRPRVLAVPVPQLRDHVPTVDSAVGPELHEHDPAAETVDGERRAIEPGAAHDVGRGAARAHLGRSGPDGECQDRPESRGANASAGSHFLSIIVSSFFIMAPSSFFIIESPRIDMHPPNTSADTTTMPMTRAAAVALFTMTASS